MDNNKTPLRDYLLVRRRGIKEPIECLPATNSHFVTEIMGANEIRANVVMPRTVSLETGDYIEYDGIEYELNRPPNYKKVSDVEHHYNIVFEHPIYRLLNKLYMYRIAGEGEQTGLTTFPLTGTLCDFLDLLVWNMNKSESNPHGIDSNWDIGRIEGTDNTDFRTIVFTNNNCREVLRILQDEFGLEYYLDNKVINFVYQVSQDSQDIEYEFEHGRGKGLYTLSRSNVDTEDTVTRLFVRGGNRNVPLGDNNRRFVDENGFLRLPEPLENFEHSNQVVERKVVFDDEFPRFLGTVDTVKIVDNNTVITCPEINFNVDGHRVGNNARINFLTGRLMGISFAFGWDNASGEITLISQEDETALPDQDGSRLRVPNSSRFAAEGDRFNFTGMSMPQSFVDASINRLRERGQAYLDFYSKKRVKYDLTIDHRFLRESGKPELKVGDVVDIIVPKEDDPIEHRITSINKNLRSGELSVVVSNYLDEKWERKVTGQISQLQFQAESTSQTLDHLTQTHLSVLSRLSIDNDRLRIRGSAFTTGEFSAFGAGSGQGGGGGGGFERLDEWSAYDASRAGWVLSAGLGWDLHTRINSFAQADHTHTISQVVGLQTALDVKLNTPVFNAHYNDNTRHITAAERTNWNTAFTNDHTHANKSIINQLTQADLDVLARLSISGGSLRIDGNAFSTGELSAFGEGTSSGGGGLSVIDNLTSTATNEALSANQGRILNNRIDSLSFAPPSHTHLWSHITDRPTTWAWENITERPTTFAPSAHNHQEIVGSDTRDTPSPLFERGGATAPGGRGSISIHLKTNTASGLSDGGSFTGVVNFNRWGDISGGSPAQLAFTDNSNIWARFGTTSWGAWRRLVFFGDNIGTGATNYAAGNHTHTFASLTNRPTTLAGYGITDANFLPLTGGTMTGFTTFATRANTVTALNAPGIEIRELNRALSQTGADSEAPRIGFHWGGRVASSLSLTAANGFSFDNQAGTGRQSVRMHNLTAAAGTFSGDLLVRNASSGVDGRLWCGTGGFAVQSNGTATLHLGQNNSTDMVFRSARIDLRKMPDIQHDSFDMMVLRRNNSGGGSSILFSNTNRILGRLGFLNDDRFAITSTTGAAGVPNMLEIQPSGSTRLFGDVRIQGGTNVYRDIQIGETATNGRRAVFANGMWHGATRNAGIQLNNEQNQAVGVMGIHDAGMFYRGSGANVFTVSSSGAGSFANTLTAPRVSLTSVGAMWLTGLTTPNNAAINIATVITSGSYHPILRATNHVGNVVNIGAINDMFGFLSYLSGRTGNAADHSIMMSLSTGNVRIGAGGTSTSPERKLEVVGNAHISTELFTPRISFNTVTTSQWAIRQSGTELQFLWNGAIRARLTSAGALVAANEVTAFGI